MVVGTDQQEEGKEKGYKKRGSDGRKRGGCKLKKEGYSYRGAPHASNSGGYMHFSLRVLTSSLLLSFWPIHSMVLG